MANPTDADKRAARRIYRGTAAYCGPTEEYIAVIIAEERERDRLLSRWPAFGEKSQEVR